MSNFQFPESWNTDSEPETSESISYDINPTILGKPTPRPDTWWSYMLDSWTPPKSDAPSRPDSAASDLTNMPQTGGQPPPVPNVLDDGQRPPDQRFQRARAPVREGSPAQFAQASPLGDDTRTDAPIMSTNPEQLPRRGVAPLTEPPSNDPDFKAALQSWKGKRVYLPDGSLVPDESSPTGYLMSPFDDLSDVAAAGRKTARDFWMKALIDPKSAPMPAVDAFRSNIGQGGAFDYQRRANKDEPTGFIQLPQFRNVSNVNVGLFGHQAGLPLEAVLTIAGIYALKNSSNAKLNKPYFLDPPTRQFIELGYRLGQSGAFNSANRATYNR